METSTVRLRALSGTPLADEKVRAVVIAAAQALAERTGVTLLGLDAAPDSLTVTLAADKIAALGFLAELRRNTGAWYRARNPDSELWGEAVD